MRKIFWARGRDPRPAPLRAPELLQIWCRLHDFSILGAEICHKITNGERRRESTVPAAGGRLSVVDVIAVPPAFARSLSARLKDVSSRIF